MALGVSMGGIDEIPHGKPGTARLLLNLELLVSSTLSEHDMFLLRGSAAMAQAHTPCNVQLQRPLKKQPYFSELSQVSGLHSCDGIHCSVTIITRLTEKDTVSLNM